MATEVSRRDHLPINGVRLYYEVYGELDAAKPPLLLIPGAFMATGSMRKWVDAFAGERAVIVFDQQGHGRTPDTPRAMSYEQFADDAAALLRALEVERADVMGYSQGGGVALQLAIRHPSLVGRLVSMSATFRRDGWYPAVPEAIDRRADAIDPGEDDGDRRRRRWGDARPRGHHVQAARRRR